MSSPLEISRRYLTEIWRAWDWFWFTPAEPHTLALLRVLGGGMLLYTHLVWTIGLGDFFGPTAWIDTATAAKLNTDADGTRYIFSHLDYLGSPLLLWAAHLAALVVFAMLFVGYHTRVAAILACALTLSYCHRSTGSLYGLDQVNAMFAIYLAIAPCGALYSVDRWQAERRGESALPEPTVATNIAMRMFQLQMCVIYIFGGISKARGVMWWDGSACWYAVANLEYQSFDCTWLVHWPWLIALLTHITLFWETFYCFFVWPKITRPICLALAIAVHGGIAIFLGMKTFGLAMIFGNLAFLEPEWVRDGVAAVSRSFRRNPEPEPLPTGATTTLRSVRV